MPASVLRCLEKVRVALLVLSLLVPISGVSRAAFNSSSSSQDDSGISNGSSSNSQSNRSSRFSNRSTNNSDGTDSNSSSSRNSSSRRRSSSKDKSSSSNDKSKEKSSSKDKSKDKNKDKSKDTGKEGDAAKQPAAKPKTLTGKAPGTTQKSSKGGQTGFSAAMAEGFGAAAAENIAILYLVGETQDMEGTQNTRSHLDLSVLTHEEFKLTVRMENLTSNNIDGFRFTLAYAAPWVEFLGYETTPLEAFAQHPDTAVQADYSKEGQLMFSGRFDTPATQRKADLLVLRFRSRDVTGTTKLKFLLPPKGEAPALSSGGENVLGRPDQNFYGVVDSTVSIKRPAEIATDQTTSGTLPLDLATAMPNEMPKQESSIEGWIGQTPLTKADAPVAIQLQAPENTTVAAGEDFWVDLVLVNDEQAPFESLSATVKFDPNVLTVLDEDEDNWTQLGVNIWDGAFHESYPFDFMRHNDADNQRGLIRYSVARNAGSWPFPTGVFARIHFQAKESVLPGATTVRLERMLNGYPVTYIHSMGVDRLEKTWSKTPPPGVALKIQAAPPVATADLKTPDAAASTSQTAQVASDGLEPKSAEPKPEK